MIAVIAGNLYEYVNWCRLLEISPTNPQLLRVKDKTDFYGHRIDGAFRIVCIGTYQYREDIDELMFFLKSHWILRSSI